MVNQSENLRSISAPNAESDINKITTIEAQGIQFMLV